MLLYPCDKDFLKNTLMKAILVTYDKETILRKNVVEISDDFKFGVDDIHGDKVPVSVGSNQTIVPFNWNEEREEFLKVIDELKQMAYQKADETDFDDVKHARWCAIGELLNMSMFREAILLAAEFDGEIAAYLNKKNILPYVMDPYSPKEDKLKVVEMMEKEGGGFVKSLAQSWRLADSYNRWRIEIAFADIFKTYNIRLASKAIG